MPTGAVIEADIAVTLRRAFAQRGQLRHKGKLALVPFPYFARLRFGHANHFCELAYAGTVDSRKVAVLGALPIDAGPICDERVKVGRWVGAVALDHLGCARQLVTGAVVHELAKFLLRDVAFSP